jgi:hypothetical protein
MVSPPSGTSSGAVGSGRRFARPIQRCAAILPATPLCGGWPGRRLGVASGGRQRRFLAGSNRRRRRL